MSKDLDDKDLGLSYGEALHGVQSAIALMEAKGDPMVMPKHLRVGIDSSQISHLAIAELLIDKGMFTSDEYCEYVRKAANAELYDWQKRVGVTFR